MPFEQWCDPADIEESAGCTADEADKAATAATLLLWRLTGRRYGTLPLRLRPVENPRREISPYGLDVGWGLPMPWPGPGPYGGIRFAFGGMWGPYSWACGDLLGGKQLQLPDSVVSVEEVEEDGVTLSGSVWRLDGSRLTRLDGNIWRRSQDVTLPPGAAGTWSISLTVGRPVPEDGAGVTLELAIEMSKEAAGKKCALPERVTQISKQGATFLLSDPMAIIKEGGTGLTRVDRWIRSVNPTRQIMPTQVWIPGEDVDGEFYTV